MKTATRHDRTDIQLCDAGGSTIAVDHKINGTHLCAVHGETLASGHLLLDTQDRAAACESSEPASHDDVETQNQNAGGFGELRAWARMLDDIEHPRIACDQRIAASRDAGREPDLHILAAREDLAHAERIFIRQVERAYKATRFHAFTFPIPGIGAKTMGRLLAEIGDPYWRAIGHHESTGNGDRRKWVIDEIVPRRCGQFLAHCGCGDPTLKRAKGVSGARMGNPRAKAIILEPSTGLAAQIMKHRTDPYRTIYDHRKAAYIATRPDWPLMHSELAARKVAVKAFLKDLWEYARDTATDEA